MPFLPETRSCVVCGVPRRAAEAPTCGSPWCLHVYSSQLAASPGRRTCAFCLRVLGPSSQGNHCGDERCRRALDLRKTAERARQIDAACEARLERHEAAVRRRLAGRLPADAPRVLLDHCAPSLVPLPRSRRFSFQAHLWGLVEQHEKNPSGPCGSPADIDPERHMESLDPSLAPIAAVACAACGGICCLGGGGDRAFLNREILLRHREAHPGAAPEDFVGDYLGRVPSLSCENSCVYHTPRGCALPPEMRSLTCGQFYCGQLRAILDLCRRKGPDLVLLAVRIERRKIHSSVLLSARGYEVVDGDPPSSSGD